MGSNPGYNPDSVQPPLWFTCDFVKIPGEKRPQLQIFPGPSRVVELIRLPRIPEFLCFIATGWTNYNDNNNNNFGVLTQVHEKWSQIVWSRWTVAVTAGPTTRPLPHASAAWSEFINVPLSCGRNTDHADYPMFFFLQVYKFRGLKVSG